VPVAHYAALPGPHPAIAIAGRNNLGSMPLPSEQPADSSGDATADGWLALLRSGRGARIAALSLGVWLHAADGLLVATMIPEIIADIGGSAFIAWTIALYEIGSITAGAASGLLALRFGVRGAMRYAALLYAIGCLLSALAPQMQTMLLGRLLQGLGGGALVAVALVAASGLFPGALLPRVMALISMVWGASAFTGPLIGGVFAALDMWRGGFVFFALQALALIAIVQRTLPADSAAHSATHSAGRAAADGAPAADPPAQRLPWRRLLVLSLAILLIAAAGIDVGLPPALLLLAGAAGLWLFLRLDAARDADRLLPRGQFDPRGASGAALLLVLCLAAATIALSAYGPVLLSTLHGSSALTAGYIIALGSIGWTLGAVATAGTPAAHDGLPILGGAGLILCCTAGLALLMPLGPLWAIALLAAGEGAGFGMAWGFVLRRATAGFDPVRDAGERARVSAALPTVQRAGCALGAAGVGIIANALGFADGIDAASATRVARWIFAAGLPLLLLGLWAAWRLCRATD